jgi:hypothetical protein
MAGKIVADIIEAPAGRISLNVANVTVASINASGLYTSTGNLLITQANSIGTDAIENGAVTTAKIAPSAIVGTVSQSGGVPTGAIIERGSNANGAFVKYADGTMICTRQFSNISTTNSVDSLFRSASQIWTFPVAYSTLNCVQGAASSTNSYASEIEFSTTSSEFFVTSSRSGTNRAAYLSAIGRWF